MDVVLFGDLPVLLLPKLPTLCTFYLSSVTLAERPPTPAFPRKLISRLSPYIVTCLPQSGLHPIYEYIWDELVSKEMRELYQDKHSGTQLVPRSAFHLVT